jgi:hypothetical protein
MKKSPVIVTLLAIVALLASALFFLGKTTAGSRTVSAVAPPVSHPLASSPLTALPAPFASLLAPFAPQVGAREGAAALQVINRSGIRALINVQNFGGTNTITGFATGMDPAKAYVSLIYDTGSVPSGPCACVPSAPSPIPDKCPSTNAPPLSFSQMVIGYWLPLTGSSTRTLQALKFGAPDAAVPLAYVPLEMIGTISVREDTQFGSPLPDRPDPSRFQLRACGKFRLDRN